MTPLIYVAGVSCQSRHCRAAWGRWGHGGPPLKAAGLLRAGDLIYTASLEMADRLAWSRNLGRTVLWTDILVFSPTLSPDISFLSPTFSPLWNPAAPKFVRTLSGKPNGENGAGKGELD